VVVRELDRLELNTPNLLAFADDSESGGAHFPERDRGHQYHEADGTGDVDGNHRVRAARAGPARGADRGRYRGGGGA
jgi:hypothetical protein